MIMQVSFPETRLVGTGEKADLGLLDLNGGIWLKRGDVHASVTADVQWIDSMERLDAGMTDFAKRGIARAALQTHRPGDEIKFYGVTDGEFFHWFYSVEPASILRFCRFESLASERHCAGLIFRGDVSVSSSGD